MSERAPAGPVPGSERRPPAGIAATGRETASFHRSRWRKRLGTPASAGTHGAPPPGETAMIGPPAHPAGHENGENGLSSERRPPAGIAAAGRETHAAADSLGVIPTGNPAHRPKRAGTGPPSSGRGAPPARVSRSRAMPAGGRRSEAAPPQLLASPAPLHFSQQPTRRARRNSDQRDRGPAAPVPPSTPRWCPPHRHDVSSKRRPFREIDRQINETPVGLRPIASFRFRVPPDRSRKPSVSGSGAPAADSGRAPATPVPPSAPRWRPSPAARTPRGSRRRPR